MAFLDEDELDAGPSSRRPDRQRQVMTRRVIAFGVAIVILILLVLAVRGCLNARKERGFENYVSDLSGIVDQSSQLSGEFFGRLLDPPNNIDPLQLEAQVAADRGTAEGLLERVEGLDVPDELSETQEELVQAFELRRDALAGIAEDIPVALAEDGDRDAIDRLAGGMRAFLASDVLYERARLEIEEVLADEGISTELDATPFLPEPADRWLDSLSLAPTLTAFATEAGTIKGLHGVALLSTTIDDTVLTPDVENTISLGNNPPEITVEVQNQGDSEESDLVVAYTLTGGAETIEAELPIDSIDPQGLAEETIGFPDLPETDVPLTLEVQVFPVLGEQVTDNNVLTYTVTFN